MERNVRRESSRIVLISGLAAFLSLSAPAQLTGGLESLRLQSLNPARRWFEPRLTINRDPICTSLRDRAARLFRSANGGFFEDPPLDSPLDTPTERAHNAELRRDPLTKWGELEVVRGSTVAGGGWSAPGITSKYTPSREDLVFTESNERTVRAVRETLSGCGGACEGQRIYLFKDEIPETFVPGDDPDQSDDTTWALPEVANGWTILRARNGDHYFAAENNGQLQFFRVTGERQEQPSCQIEMQPANLRSADDPALNAAVAAIDAFEKAVDAISPVGGYCGTLQTEYRWADERRHGYELALVRPWLMQPRPLQLGDRQSENSWGDYTRIRLQLEQWSLGGLFEYRAHAAYLAELEKAANTIGGFYEQKFGWDAPLSRTIARNALTEAMSNGMGFYMYEPYPIDEAALRRAILSHQTFSTLKQLPVDARSATHMLDIAVAYPQALEYLLEHGAEPNQSNGFGKTALMYAAQYNQLESVKLLLKYGADPNARTFIPDDRCNYTLQTDGMTALHYAVRYASAPLIDALLDGQALVFTAASGGTPLEWLRRYTADSKDRNSHLSTSDVEHLSRRLQPSTPDERQRLARKLVDEAEQDYRAKRYRLAMRGFVAALSAVPDEPSTMASLQLTALRAGQPGLSLQISDKLLARTTDRRTLANVWFNRGLACVGQHYLQYENRFYCRSTPLIYFVESWKLGHSTARQDKIDELMASADRACTLKQTSGTWRIAIAYWQDESTNAGSRVRQRIFVQHPVNDRIAASDVTWQERSSFGSPESRSPTFLDRLDTEAYALTILESAWPVGASVNVRGQVCQLPDNR